MVRRLLILCCCVWVQAGKDPFAGKKHGSIGPVKVLQAYQIAPEEADVIYAADLSRDASGELIILEGKTSHVHRWSAEGKWLGDVGGEGQGPGETDGLIRVALGKEHIYGYQFTDPVVIWPRDKYGAEANREARKLPYDGPFSMVFRVFYDAKGAEQLLMAGQLQSQDGLGEVVWRLVNPVDGHVTELKPLTTVPEYPMWDLYSADGTQPLRLCPPRAWAASDRGRLVTGFSSKKYLQYLDKNGTLGDRIDLNLPARMPEAEDHESFYETPIPMLLKSLKELGFRSLKLQDRPMARYTLFVPMGERWLFFNTIFGSFNNVNYLQNGAECLVYDMKQGKIEGRGILKLPENAILYPIDEHLMLGRFDEDDMLVLERVALGWVD